jgi:hypothetical protein
MLRHTYIACLVVKYTWTTDVNPWASHQSENAVGLPRCGYSLSCAHSLLTWRIWRAPNNASRWQMGFNSAFEGLKAEWAAVTFWCNKYPCISRAQNYGPPTLRNVPLLSELSTWCAGKNIWLYGAKLGNENLKTATTSADYDRSKTTGECGIIPLFG